MRRAVDGVQTLSADAYVVALGSYSPFLLRPLGIRPLIYPVKGYSVTLPISNPVAVPQVSLTDDSYKLVFSRLGERLRVAGTAELTGYDTSLNAARCDAILRRVAELFPYAGDLEGARVGRVCGPPPRPICRMCAARVTAICS